MAVDVGLSLNAPVDSEEVNVGVRGIHKDSSHQAIMVQRWAGREERGGGRCCVRVSYLPWKEHPNARIQTGPRSFSLYRGLPDHFLEVGAVFRGQ